MGEMLVPCQQRSRVFRNYRCNPNVVYWNRCGLFLKLIEEFTVNLCRSSRDFHNPHLWFREKRLKPSLILNKLVPFPKAMEQFA